LLNKIEARLIATTQPTVALPVPDGKGIMAYCARVSSDNPDNPDTDTLLNYCKRHGHWSVFEMCNAVVEVIAPRDISRQLLRHRSFSFQEFSQRYSDRISFTDREIRLQDHKNRQSSHDFDDEALKQEWEEGTQSIVREAYNLYRHMINSGVAKETARVVLPEGLTMSHLFVNGSIRSWVHYLNVREEAGTQKEHRELANKIRQVLVPAFPGIFDE